MIYKFIKMVANRNVRRLRRYRLISSTQTYIFLTGKEGAAIATAITIIGKPIMIKSAFDSLPPLLEKLDKSEKINLAIKKSIDDYQNLALYQKLLDNISIEGFRNSTFFSSKN